MAATRAVASRGHKGALLTLELMFNLNIEVTTPKRIYSMDLHIF